MTPFRDHSFLTGSSTLWVAPDWDGETERRALADPDRLFSVPGCEIIKDQKKIKVGRIYLEIGGRPRSIFVKRYNAFSLRYRLGSLVLCSGARRSWIGAATLIENGFQTGRPIAAVECRSWGMLTKSFYLSEGIAGARTSDEYWREELVPLSGPEGFGRRRSFLKRLAGLFRALHDARIYHNDLKDANILVRCPGNPTGESFYLLDLEGIRRRRHLSQRRQVKNLVQLNRTLGKLLSRSERLYFLRSYLGVGFREPKEKERTWLGRVLRATRRGDRHSARKRLGVRSSSGMEAGMSRAEF